MESDRSSISSIRLSEQKMEGSHILYHQNDMFKQLMTSKSLGFNYLGLYQNTSRYSLTNTKRLAAEQAFKGDMAHENTF